MSQRIFVKDDTWTDRFTEAPLATDRENWIDPADLGITGATGPVGATGATGACPFFIPLGETFTVPENKQVLAYLPCAVDGYLILDGYWIQL